MDTATEGKMRYPRYPSVQAGQEGSGWDGEQHEAEENITADRILICGVRLRLKMSLITESKND